MSLKMDKNMLLPSSRGFFFVAYHQRYSIEYLCLPHAFCKQYLSKSIISHKLQQKKIKLSMEVPYDDNFSDRY